MTMPRIGLQFPLALATLVLLAGALSFARPAAAAGSMISIKSGTETIQAYLALPATPAKGGPAIVVIHEWYGLSDWVKGVADRFAAQGYVAIAPDMYRGHLATTPEEAHELMRGLPDARAKRDVLGAAAYVQGRKDLAPKKTAVIGFCMGGRISQMSALDKGPFDACVMCYGSPESEPARLKTLKGPLLGIFGGDDRGIGADQTGPLADGLKKAGKPGSAVHVYPGVGHAFLRDAGSPAGEEQAKLAWAEIDGFLKANLGK
jgi:carboxymethylenebutenolidase